MQGASTRSSSPGYDQPRPLSRRPKSRKPVVEKVLIRPKALAQELGAEEGSRGRVLGEIGCRSTGGPKILTTSSGGNGASLDYRRTRLHECDTRGLMSALSFCRWFVHPLRAKKGATLPARKIGSSKLVPVSRGNLALPDLGYGRGHRGNRRHALDDPLSVADEKTAGEKKRLYSAPDRDNCAAGKHPPRDRRGCGAPMGRRSAYKHLNRGSLRCRALWRRNRVAG